MGRRVQIQTLYEPGLEDWAFHFLLPFSGYLLIAGAGVAAPFSLRWAMFAVGAGVLMLLFSGVHNAWDDVAYIAVNRVALGGRARTPGRRRRMCRRKRKVRA